MKWRYLNKELSPTLIRNQPEIFLDSKKLKNGNFPPSTVTLTDKNGDVISQNGNFIQLTGTLSHKRPLYAFEII